MDEKYEQIKKAIENVFDFLNTTDYGLTWERQELEALFWDKFFDYFRKLQKTEKNRIINQLCDVD